jgi:hypothetical protein
MSTRDDTYGPGIQWLAEQAGVPPDRLLHDPAGLLQALAAATVETAELVANAALPDPDVRRAATARAEELHARLTAAPTAAQRFGRTVAQALRDQAERLRGED